MSPIGELIDSVHCYQPFEFTVKVAADGSITASIPDFKSLAILLFQLENRAFLLKEKKDFLAAKNNEQTGFRKPLG